MSNIPNKNRKYLVFIYDSIAIVLSISLAYFSRFDFKLSSESLFDIFGYLLWAYPVKAGMFYFFASATLAR